MSSDESTPEPAVSTPGATSPASNDTEENQIERSERDGQQARVNVTVDKFDLNEQEAAERDEHFVSVFFYILLSILIFIAVVILINCLVSCILSCMKDGNQNGPCDCENRPQPDRRPVRRFHRGYGPYNGFGYGYNGPGTAYGGSYYSQRPRLDYLAPTRGDAFLNSPYYRNR